MSRLIRTVLTLWILVLPCVFGLALAGCGSRPAVSTTSARVDLPAVMPADFGFVANYGAYGRNRMDTFDWTFTKDIVSQTKPNPTVALHLTTQEMTSLYDDLRSIHILDYPDTLDPSNTGKTGITASTPTSYSLQIRVGDIEKTVRWEHGEFARTEQAKSLLSWFDRLQAMIQTKPEYQRMPPLEGGYA